MNRHQFSRAPACASLRSIGRRGFLSLGAGFFGAAALFLDHRAMVRRAAGADSASDPADELPALRAGRGAQAFPLRIADDRRHFVDASGKPFLLTGDTGWSLIADLTFEEADLYLEDRAARGFNATLVNLIEHQFARNAPANAAGVAPFGPGGAFADPVDAYFRHARRVVERAAAHGLVVFLTPAYLGAMGGGQGWYVEMNATGPAALEAYGAYVARQFAGLSNIIWVAGGDHDPERKELVSAVVSGIRSVDPAALHVMHGGRDTDTRAFWRGEDWLDVASVYTYEAVFPAVSAAVADPETMPVVLIEALYEGEHATDLSLVRAQAYGAILGGAAGQIFGNNPMWHFGGPGLYGSTMTWQEALASRGAASMTILKRLFDTLEWWKIAPAEAAFLEDVKKRRDNAQAFAGLAADRSFAVVYVDGVDSLSVAPGLLPEGLPARWLDPSDGSLFANDSGPEDEGEGVRRRFTPPRPSNAEGTGDWVLVLAGSQRPNGSPT